MDQDEAGAGQEWDSDGLGYHWRDDEAAEEDDAEMADVDDRGPLGDKPAPACTVAGRGKYGRAQAMGRAIEPAGSVHKAARRLRDLAPGVLGPALALGQRAGRDACVLPCLCVLKRHGRVWGRNSWLHRATCDCSRRCAACSHLLVTYI